MAEIVRFTDSSDWIDLVERERTPKLFMELGIRLHLAELSLSNIVSEFGKFGVDRSRKRLSDWIQNAAIATDETTSPDQVALNETVVKVNGEIFRFYSAVDPKTNKTLLTRSIPRERLR